MKTSSTEDERVSDERLAKIIAGPGIFAGDEPDIYTLLTELQSLRAAQPDRASIVEECAKMADAEQDYQAAISNKASAAKDMAAHYKANTAWWAAHRIANAIRALTSPPRKEPRSEDAQ